MVVRRMRKKMALAAIIIQAALRFGWQVAVYAAVVFALLGWRVVNALRRRRGAPPGQARSG